MLEIGLGKVGGEVLEIIKVDAEVGDSWDWGLN